MSTDLFDNSDLGAEDYEWDVFVPDPDEALPEAESSLETDESELDLDDSAFDWEGTLEDEPDADGETEARVAAAFDRMRDSMWRSPDEMPTSDAAQKDEGESEFVMIPDPEMHAPGEGTELQGDTIAEAEEPELIVLPDRGEIARSETDTAGTDAGFEWDDGLQDPLPPPDAAPDADDPDLADDLTAQLTAELAAEITAEVTAKLTADLDDETDSGLPEEELDAEEGSDAGLARAADNEWDAWVEAQAGTEADVPTFAALDAATTSPEPEADEVPAGGEADGGIGVGVGGGAEFETPSDTEAARPAWLQDEPAWLQDDPAWLQDDTVPAYALAAAPDGEHAGPEKDVHSEFVEPEPTPGPSRAHSRGADTREHSRVFTATAVIACLLLVVIAAVGIVRVLHRPTTTGAGTSSTQLASIQTATFEADSATTTAQAGMSSLPAVPTPAQVAAVVNPYVASLRLYETVLSGASVPAAAQSTVQSLATQIRRDVAFLSSIDGLPPVRLGSYLTQFATNVTQLQATLSTLEGDLQPTTSA